MDFEKTPLRRCYNLVSETLRCLTSQDPEWLRDPLSSITKLVAATLKRADVVRPVKEPVRPLENSRRWENSPGRGCAFGFAIPSLPVMREVPRAAEPLSAVVKAAR